MSLIDFACNGGLESSLRGESQDSRPASSLRGSGVAIALQSIPNRHTERSEVSKTRESSAQSKSMIKKRINKSDSNLKHYDSIILDSRDLDSSLQATLSAQNDRFGVDCFCDKSPRNDEMGTDCHENKPTLIFLQ